MIKKLRKENTNICTNKFLTKYEETVTLVSVTGHMAIVGICNYLP